MRLSIAGLAVALLFGSNEAAFAADADNGSRLAQRWCASCHIVTGTQSRGTDAVPSFASIAQREGFSADRLAFFLLIPHPIMPNMSLSRDEAQDIAAYIATQRR
jgi:mono/diheme cytochrome c family protein